MARRITLIVLAAAVAASAATAAVVARNSTMTFEQMERKYPRMTAVHMRKCDRDGDGLYNRAEALCVSSVYSTMYLND